MVEGSSRLYSGSEKHIVVLQAESEPFCFYLKKKDTPKLPTARRMMSQNDGDINTGEHTPRPLSRNPPSSTTQISNQSSPNPQPSPTPSHTSNIAIPPRDASHSPAKEHVPNRDGPESPRAGSKEPQEALEHYDWDDLEARFLAEMEKCRKAEEEIGEEFKEWLAVRFEEFSYYSSPASFI